MSDYKPITGYKYPYRIHTDATIEQQLDDGTWVKVDPFIQHDGSRRADRLSVHLIATDGHRLVRAVKKLMIDAFLGGSKPGVFYGLRNGYITDCSLENIYLLTEKDKRKKRKAYRKYREEKERQNAETKL